MFQDVYSHPMERMVTVEGPYRIRVGNREFEVKPAPVKSVTAQGLKLEPGEHPTWRDGTGLPGTHLVYRTLIPASLKLYSPDGTRYGPGRDYRLHPRWAKLTRPPGSRIRAGQKVLADYRYRLSRIDLIQEGSRGRVSLRQGKPSLTCPVLPAVKPGCRPVAAVYLSPAYDRILKSNILPIRPVRRAVSTGTRPERTLAKMKNGEPATIVCFGDSITHYGDASSRDKAWFGLLKKHLGSTYPRSRIRMINAGEGGNNTDQGLQRMSHDVIQLNPDLLLIAFGVNDENGPKGGTHNAVAPAQYERNLKEMIRRLRRAGSEIILVTPTLKNPGWNGASGTMTRYADIMRRLARTHRTGLADVNRAWRDLKYSGIPFVTYLNTCINHPNDHGHLVIFKTLKPLFYT